MYKVGKSIQKDINCVYSKDDNKLTKVNQIFALVHFLQRVTLKLSYLMK